jgi:hypothetical protein
MGVTNIWHVMNLGSTPFFQDPLSPGERAQHPIDLFVGRQEEAHYILSGIGSAQHSRHVVQGSVGVGKTTLVQYVKAAAAEDGYLADVEAVAVTSAATTDDLRLRILLSAYTALVAHDAGLARRPAMEEVRHILGVERDRAFNVSVGLPAGGSVGAGTSLRRHTGPGALAVRPERLLRDLSDLLLTLEGVPGILIHINNLENLAEAAQANAARVLRDLRDTALMYSGLHYLFVGTDEAVRAVMTGDERLRSVVSNPGSLRPLRIEEVESLLERRYEHLRLFDDRPVPRPVTQEALRAVYAVFRGNLRGLLQALDEAARVLIGRGDDPTAPMGLEQLRPVLTTIYNRKLESDLDGTQQDQAQKIADRGLDALVTAKQMERPFGLRYTATNSALGHLIQKGYIEAAGEAPPAKRPGRPSRKFRLTGAGRLAFGALLGSAGMR